MSRIVSEDVYAEIEYFCELFRDRYTDDDCVGCPFVRYNALKKNKLAKSCDIEMKDGWEEVEDNEQI